MRNGIDLRVCFRGQERLLRLVKYQGEWHAALPTPGKVDMLTGECPVPSPPGTRLPAMTLQGFDLRVKRPPGKVERLDTGRLLTSGGVAVESGRLLVRLRSIMADYQDDIGSRRGKKSLAELKAGGKGRRKARPGDRDRDMER